MSESDRSGRPAATSLPPWALVAAVASAGALIYATHLYLYHRLQGEPASFALELAEAAVHFGAWAVLVPSVVRLARRSPVIGPRWLPHLLLHVGLGLGVALAQLLIHTLLDRVLVHGWRDWATFAGDARGFFARTYYANVMVYLAIVVGDGVRAWGRQRREREAELERHLALAQLDALRQQLQPHFLFNALNAVSTLVADDPPAAQRMIARLADLLRQALDARNAAEVPLWRELDLARSYLAIEQVRFGDRLTVTFDVAAEAREALVPGLLLQPLLENAVRHGLAARPGPGTIEVSARIADATLWLRVADRGPVAREVSRRALAPLPPPVMTHVGESAAGGIGLSNVRARLRHLYGDAQDVTMTTDARGAAVDVRLPARMPPAATARDTTRGAAAR